MMRDEIFDREYQAGRADLNASIDRLIDGIARSLRVLNVIQFDAPWKHDGNQRTSVR
jgi:acetaldehyde dehydrogenase (acetylating)